MVRRDLRAHRNERVGRDTKLRDLALRLDLGDGEMAALGARDILHFRLADAELDGGIAILLDGAVRDDLAMVDLEHGHRDVLARVGEDAGHADLLRDDA